MELTRQQAYDLVRQTINQLEDEKLTKISIPIYAVENKNDPIGIKNVNFSTDSANDVNSKYYEKWKNQRLNRGFDDTELWCLEQSILNFILPRIETYKENLNGFPGKFKTMDEWLHILDEIIWSIKWELNDSHKEYVTDENDNYVMDENKQFILTDDYKRAKNGLKLLGEYITDLYD